MRQIVLIITVMVSFVMFGCGIAGYKLVKNDELDAPPPSPSAALDGALTVENHEGPLHKTLTSILNGGKVVDRWAEGTSEWVVVDGQHIPHEKVDEYWIVKDKGGNYHKVTLKNGTLYKIERGENPNKTATVEPYTGWSE